MWRVRWRADFGVVRQGVDLAWEYGVRPIEQLVRIAELLEKTVYEKGSLARIGPQIEFTLLNPPLRMGAFNRIVVRWDGSEIPPSSVYVRAGTDPSARSLDSLGADHPLTLPIGERTRFTLRGLTVPDGKHTIRLELHSAAIPPTVWLEFSDHLEARPAA